MAQFCNGASFVEPLRSERLYGFLWQLTYGAFKAGQLDPDAEIAKPMVQSAHTRSLRDRKQAIDDDRMQRLDDAVAAVANKRPLKISSEFANMIRPGLQDRLGYSPGDTAIKASVRRLKGVGS